jgi:hypothetical protein
VNVATTRALPATRTLTDRLLAAAPLLSVFVWLCVVYGWEAWRHGSPWLFGDELELTQLSRSIADTGHAARRGYPYSPHSLYTYLLAPAWLIHDTHRAYAAVRYLGVGLMTLTVFPAYALARTVVSRPPALFVAAAAATIPAVAYTSLIVEEPFAYLYSTICLLLIARALAVRSRWWIAGAVVASVIAPLVRGELVVIPVVFVLGALVVVWCSEQASRWRASWKTWDWVGFFVLATGVLVLFSAVLGRYSFQWFVATDVYKHRMFVLGLRAAGALTIGLGVLPVVAGLASLWPVRRERRTRELTAFRAVLIASVVAFGLYTAAKATYVSTTFGTYTYERNLIYLAPLLFAGTAVWIERRRLNPLAVALAGGFALYLVLSTPYEMDKDSSYNAPGLAILEQSNRWLGLTPLGAKIVLTTALAITLVVLLLPARVVARARGGLVGVVALVVLAWNLTGEIGFANASNRFSSLSLSNIHGNPTWLDDATGGAPALYLGQQMKDQNSENLLEFWNRSLKQIWSLDGTAPGPGPALTPDLHARDGTLFPDPGYPYVVAEPGIEPVGQRVAIHYHRAGGGFEAWQLYRIAHPLRLRHAVTGLYPGGWSGANDTAYTRYSTSGARRGTMSITVSRREWGGPDTKSKVTILMGTLKVGSDRQPAIGRVTATRTWFIHSRLEKTFVLRAPGPRFRVEIKVDPKFVPRELSPQTSSDPRQLGAVVTYRFSDSRRRDR